MVSAPVKEIFAGSEAVVNSISEPGLIAENPNDGSAVPFATISKLVVVNDAAAAVSMIFTGTEVSTFGKLNSNSCSFFTSNDSPNHCLPNLAMLTRSTSWNW